MDDNQNYHMKDFTASGVVIVSATMTEDKCQFYLKDPETTMDITVDLEDAFILMRTVYKSMTDYERQIWLEEDE